MTRAAALRLFIAAYPPEGVIQAMLGSLPALGLPEHKATPPEQVHLTVLFLGERRADLVPEILDSMRAAAAAIRPFSLTAERLISLPQRGRARLVAVEFDARAGLDELQFRLANRLAAEDRRGRKAFLPHMTLCRFPGTGAQVRIDKPVVGEFPGFEVRQVRLVRSVLHPLGARHEPVGTVALGRGEI